MPASYAHYRFGKLLLPAVPPDTRQCIQRFRRMFDVGLQGPDFFFYYNPLMKTAVGSLGGHYHSQTGREFFAHACAAATTEAGRAYLYGLLGHYCLDSGCHPFVNKVTDSGQARHIALESEFDRYLLEQDGESSPSTFDMSRYLKLTRGECMTVAQFFPPATGGHVSRSVSMMRTSLKFLAGKNRKLRVCLFRHLHPGLLDSLIPEQPVAAYARMDSELLARFNRCQKQYLNMLAQLEAFRRDETPLGEEFEPTFG